MKIILDENTNEKIKNFHLPRYHELTNVGLYLDQITRLVNGYLESLDMPLITSSMVSNYVKQKLIPSPTKKAYYADSIAYLIVVSFVKSVMSLEDIKMIEQVQITSYPVEVTYNYFCDEFENTLKYIFNITDELKEIGNDDTLEKELFKQTILTLSNRIYLKNCLDYFKSSK